MIIRYKCFETNSSSTHALCIGKGLKLYSPLELITKYKNTKYLNNDFEVMDHSGDYLPITDEYFNKVIRKEYLSYGKDKDDKKWKETRTYLSLCEEYCLDYMNSHTDTLLLRRFENLGRQFKIYETPLSKLNFIWTCLCCYANRPIKDDNYCKTLCEGNKLLQQFLDCLTQNGFKLKFMDVKFVNTKTVKVKNYYNSPKILGIVNGKDIIGKETYGYFPMQELVKIIGDPVLFFNLIFGNSKIYTGSDEYDTFEDLDFNSYLYRLVGGSDSTNCNFDNIHKHFKPKCLGEYVNGNYKTTIYPNGTRIRELQPEDVFYTNKIFKQDLFTKPEIDIMKPQFPESIDLKITDYCENNCKFCYANSSKEGKHANIDFIKEIINQMHPYTEIAIGGGNALAHPNLIEILQYAKSRKVICNITLKDTDIIQKADFVQNLITRDLVKQVGISPTTLDTLEDAINILNHVSWDMFIVHFVLGLHDKKFFEKLQYRDLPIYKMLILGYKIKGRGENFYNENLENVKQCIEDFKYMLDKKTLPLTPDIIAFDNLAINQLGLKNSEPIYKDFYQGDDGKFSFYIDAVNRTYAKSSLSELCKSFTNYTTLESIMEQFNEEEEGGNIDEL